MKYFKHAAISQIEEVGQLCGVILCCKTQFNGGGGVQPAMTWTNCSYTYLLYFIDVFLC